MDDEGPAVHWWGHSSTLYRRNTGEWNIYLVLMLAAFINTFHDVVINTESVDCSFLLSLAFIRFSNLWPRLSRLTKRCEVGWELMWWHLGLQSVWQWHCGRGTLYLHYSWHGGLTTNSRARLSKSRSQWQRRHWRFVTRPALSAESKASISSDGGIIIPFIRCRQGPLGNCWMRMSFCIFPLFPRAKCVWLAMKFFAIPGRISNIFLHAASTAQCP